MSKTQTHQHICTVCGKSFPAKEAISGATVRDTLSELILRDHPDWSPDAFICRADLSRYNTDYVESILESERGELTSLEKEVVDSLRQHEILSTNVDAESEKTWTFGERLADKVATFGGSWTFLICFAAFLAAWVVMNSAVLYWHPIDPYPFIFLNLMLSCLAAIQAPIIMMSQNRQEAKDRLRSEHDYQVNLKAELEIRHLNEKLDHLLSHQWERLVQIQQVQIQMLAQLERR
ncbi:hypothetical protein SCT_1752 [Sulfuricella sp. T08]|uniref:DUF1003 domain-containing protein n=1 Tax=Sulfuricella sp. T08 TaxID=1632857 RepID=UPI00061798C9|nr:DUF1003 domain-containing protein [Sulfuricella sp. T08]GAO36346.1 hypothetical protein SCT_1752 [Sulfuricella sp. T08]